jgi:thioredoxin-related protein
MFFRYRRPRLIRTHPGHLLLPACVLALVLMSTAAFPQEKGKAHAIQWLEFDKAVAAAKKERKLIVVDFYTDWCGWCKKMDQDTYGHAEVVKYAREKLVMSKVNAESQQMTRYKDNEMSYQQLALNFGVRGYPATIFINENGEWLTSVSGYLKPDQFLPILEFLSEGHYKTMKFEDFMQKRKS